MWTGDSIPEFSLYIDLSGGSQINSGKYGAGLLFCNVDTQLSKTFASGCNFRMKLNNRAAKNSWRAPVMNQIRTAQVLNCWRAVGCSEKENPQISAIPPLKYRSLKFCESCCRQSKAFSQSHSSLRNRVMDWSLLLKIGRFSARFQVFLSKPIKIF